MKKLIALAVIALIAGCTTWDLNGDGKVDIGAYLQGVDITLAWTDKDGAPYYFSLDEDGVSGKFTDPKTDIVFEKTKLGGFTITDPNGVTVRIKQKAE